MGIAKATFLPSLPVGYFLMVSSTEFPGILTISLTEYFLHRFFNLTQTR
jgi:hypothetical protein